MAPLPLCAMIANWADLVPYLAPHSVWTVQLVTLVLALENHHAPRVQWGRCGSGMGRARIVYLAQCQYPMRPCPAHPAPRGPRVQVQKYLRRCVQQAHCPHLLATLFVHLARLVPSLLWLDRQYAPHAQLVATPPFPAARFAKRVLLAILWTRLLHAQRVNPAVILYSLA